MSIPFFARNVRINRRHVLKGLGTSVSLPMLGAMTPAFGVESKPKRSVPRFVAMNASLGFHTPHLFPQKEGSHYELTPYLQRLKEHRKDLTLISGLSHPNQNGNNGHASHLTWLTSAQRPGLAGFKNSISLDQVIASHVGHQTRLPFLSLTNTGTSLSWTANGVNIPAERSPAKLFKTLFIDGTAKEVESELKGLSRGQSVLDTVLRDANRLQQKVGKRDKEKLDEYFSAIRDLENRMNQNAEWSKKPKPKVDREVPTDVADRNDILAKQRLMYDMMVLALQTDSTRSITFDLGALNSVPSHLNGVKTDWHNLSHHGKDEEKIKELKLIEEAEFDAFNEFLTALKNVSESGKSLLEHTSVLFGSNLGDASSHNWRNLPIIIAGGGFKHGSYVAHDEKNNTPLANLFVTLAQRMGIENDSFGSSTAASVRGLEAS
jgi:BMFP domain-containing protein YqiC